MRRFALPAVGLAVLLVCGPVIALDRPWISDTFFYWYEWDYQKEMGSWIGGVYNTPMVGYYDSRSYEDNLRELHMASEWGITDHFMDFWGRGWQDTEGNPRESALIRATEALQDRGYDIHMSFYQDGTDFDMNDFAANMGEGRQVRWLFENYGKSRALPLINGKPVWLVYGRNGRPAITNDQDGFREWLCAKYPSVALLNEAWGTELKSFDEATMSFGSGVRRADSIKYQYAHWAREMAALDGKTERTLGLPGLLPSFDVAWQPYMGYDYSDQARVLNGPHSYGGIFGQPQEQDVERFIQTAVAKRYGTVCFDTFKNYYHDWEIRTPGSCYPPEPAHFDRFWVGNLMRYAEAMLHLSWNEWWEGSNLEPCLEYGKTYCEKNLLYATIMKLTFDSIHAWNRGAKVAVLLNDWHWLVGGRHPEDVYNCIQALRRENITFDLLPDDFVTDEQLSPVEVLLVPAADAYKEAGGVELGRNRDGELITEVIKRWIRTGQGRKLLVSDMPSYRRWLDIKEQQAPPGTAEQGPDMTLFVDVGEGGDEKFLLGGATQREDWGKLPEGSYGATNERLTVRWTPGSGETTRWLVPLSPNRDHILRIAGSSIWPNTVHVLIDGVEGGSFELEEGVHEYEVSVPAAVVGGKKAGVLTLRYEKSNVPKKLDPERFPSESRVCNFGVDWLQWSTANMPKSRDEEYELPQERIAFTGDAPRGLRGRRASIPYTPHALLDPGNAVVMSRYTSDGAPRDIAVTEGGNEVLYVNGLLGQSDDPAYFHAILGGWAGATPDYRVEGEKVIGTRLAAGNTAIVFAYNYDIREPRDIVCTLPIKRPIAEVRALTRDGVAWQDVEHDADYNARTVTIRDRIKYYGVYEVVFSDVRVTNDELAIQPGETKRFEMSVKNLTSKRVEGTLRLMPLLPSLSAPAVPFTLAPRAQKQVTLAITARDDADWGRKTIVLEAETGQRKPSYFWRSLAMQRPPEMRVSTVIAEAPGPAVAVENVENEYMPSGTAHKVRLQLADVQARFGDIEGGGSATKALPLKFEPTEEPSVVARDAKIIYEVGGKRREADTRLHVALHPEAFRRMESAIAPICIYNPTSEYLENAVVSVDLSGLKLPKDFDFLTTHVREAGGAVIPSQINLDTRELLVLAMLPPEQATIVYLCDGIAVAPATDLAVAAEGLDTGHGEVAAGNSHYRLALAEQVGGTATQFVVRGSGTDYAAPNLFGVAYGSWGHFDPLHPRTNTATYIGTETKVRQADAPAKITVLERGPLRATVRVEWSDDALKASQTYRFLAYQDYFTVRSSVTPKRLGDVDEVVALDVKLRRNGLTKIFPNFTGIPASFEQDKAQHGWRQAPHVPDVAAFMIPNRYEETISLIPLRREGIEKFRQGFWPEERPKPGPARWAQIEYVSTDKGRAELSVCVLVRPGHQVVAQKQRRLLQQPPLTYVPRKAQWAEGTALKRRAAGRQSGGAPWWNPYWHYRLPLVIARAAPGRAENIGVPVDLPARLRDAGAEGAFDGASVRTVLTDAELRPVAVLASRLAEGELQFALPASAPERATVYVYFDTTAHGTKKPPRRPVAALSTKLLGGSFEGQKGHWDLSQARLATEGAHSGRSCVALDLKDDAGTRVIANRSMLIKPHSQYRLTLWAKTETPGASVRANIYDGAEFDFPQVSVPLTADGAWHQYETTLTAGDFPPDVKPYLRLWIINKAQLVLLDDVALELIGGAPEVEKAEVAVGDVEGPR